MHKSMSLTHEPFSEPLHISVRLYTLTYEPLGLFNSGDLWYTSGQFDKTTRSYFEGWWCFHQVIAGDACERQFDQRVWGPSVLDQIDDLRCPISWLTGANSPLSAEK